MAAELEISTRRSVRWNNEKITRKHGLRFTAKIELLPADDIRDKPATRDRGRKSKDLRQSRDNQADLPIYGGPLREFRDYFDDATRP